MAAEKKTSWLPLLVFLGLAAFLWIISSQMSNGSQAQVSYSDFLKELESGRISQVEVSETQLIGTLAAANPEGESRVVAARPPDLQDPRLLQLLTEKNITVRGKPKSGSWLDLLAVWLLPLLFIFLILGGVRAARQATMGQMGFGKSRAKIYDQYTHSDVTFKDVAGVDEAENELVEVVDFLKNPQKYTRLGGRIPKGVLLVGPPGTGKTLLAKAVSGESGVPFLYISGSEFMEMFVGVGAARVRDLFDQAKQRAPCIIFIDELDAIGKTRSPGQAFLSHDERDQTLNQLLAEMDGFDTSSGVILLAATNTPEVLDPALLRAGRFDRQVLVDRPDVDGREAILRVHAAKVKLSPNVDLKTIAARTPGMVGADLANVINEGALLAARRQSDTVEMKDLEEAIDRILLGLEKKHRVMSAQEKERIAYHEAGHALIALSVPHANPVHRVSIIPRAIGALGHTLQLPTEERYLMTLPELQDQITVMLGGRVAEELVYHGEISTGASDDLEKASELARQMVTRFGMSPQLGYLTYGRPLRGRFLSGWSGEERNYSERTAEAIDDEVRRVSNECYERAKAIVTSRREDLERLARELVEKETVDRERLEQLLGIQLPPTPSSEQRVPVS